MKKPTRRRKPAPPVEYFSYQLRQPAVDLFGEVAITEDDLFSWVASISPIHCSDRGYDNYVRRYDVAGKVRWAKLQGTFESMTARRPNPWHARLALNAIV